MNRTLLLAKSRYSEMGRSEKKIADFLFAHSGEEFPYSITELAEQCQSSEATVVRFSKRLGFAGYQELKLSLAKEYDRKVITPHITREDDSFVIFEKLCNDMYLSLERTKKNLTLDCMTSASDAIVSADRLVLIGLGSSATVAAEASNKFLRAGCNSHAYSDTHMQAIAVSQMRAGDVLIGVSQSGSSKDIVECMKLAKGKGVTTVALTATDKSPIIRQSDIVLLTDTEEVRHGDLALASHMARNVVLDALCYHVAYRMEERRGSILSDNAATLDSKRIRDTQEP